MQLAAFAKPVALERKDLVLHGARERLAVGRGYAASDHAARAQRDAPDRAARAKSAAPAPAQKPEDSAQAAL